MIPRLIHQLWIDPHAPAPDSPQRHRYQKPPVPPDVQENCASWSTQHPTFNYRLWSLDDISNLTPLSDHPELRAALLNCRFPAMQADLARLFLLELFGGFWIDLKLFALQPITDELIDYDLVVTEHFPKENLREPNGFLINSFIGARPYHPCISHALDEALHNVFGRKQGSIFYVAGGPVL
ncbi:MAG: capsular polysaccharide synthesis protein [Acidiphilium sp.]|nr:capsular polysaccharide synthesis protein [Acidiphilium sp.]MDD4936903.1 capsular polysaccharide synthesis protein [Acidiphilium sp.]